MITCHDCKTTLKDGKTNSGADHGPVTVSGWYNHNGGHAYFFWDRGRLTNAPAICTDCLHAHQDAEARAEGFKDRNHLMAVCWGV